MRLVPVLILTALVSLFASVSRAATPSMAGAGGTPDQRLEQAAKELDKLDELLREAPSAKEVSTADLVGACQSSFTLAGMANDIRGWLAQGSPLRGMLTQKGEFESFSVKTITDVVQLTTKYQECLSGVSGKPTCEPLQLLSFLPQVTASCVQTAPKAEKSLRVKNTNREDDRMLKDLLRGDKAAAKALCMQVAPNWRTFKTGSEGAACDLIVANWKEPAAVCGEGAALLNPGASCAAQIGQLGELLGDPRACAGLEGDRRVGCDRRAKIRAGHEEKEVVVKPKVPPVPKDCSESFGKLRTWYCGRYSWPTFAKMTADLKQTAKGGRAADRSARLALARTEIKAVNDIVADLVARAQMAPLTSAQSAKIQAINEHRDRLLVKLDDGRAKAPEPTGRQSAKKSKKAAEPAAQDDAEKP